MAARRVWGREPQTARASWAARTASFSFSSTVLVSFYSLTNVSVFSLSLSLQLASDILLFVASNTLSLIERPMVALSPVSRGESLGFRSDLLYQIAFSLPQKSKTNSLVM